MYNCRENYFLNNKNIITLKISVVYKYSLYLLFVSLDKHPIVPLSADICRCY